MREILFRGKKHNGEWYYGSYLFLNVSASDWKGDSRGKEEPVHYIVNEKDINYAVDPETVGQYTGLTDKNGMRIFEGDIVVAALIGGSYQGFSWGAQKVVFHRGSFCLEDRRGNTTPLTSYAPRVEFEIIGNVHDNPELMNR